MIEQIMNCRNCKLCENQLPLLDKTKACDIMWVGLSAKKVENVYINYPLESNTNSGKLIYEIENRNKNMKYYKTNLVKCLPLDKKNKIRYPTKNEMEKCVNNLLIEINSMEPKIVFLLGNIVYSFVNEYIKNNNMHLKSKLIKVEHPSYIYVYKRKNKEEYIQGIIDEIERSR